MRDFLFVILVLLKTFVQSASLDSVVGRGTLATHGNFTIIFIMEIPPRHQLQGGRVLLTFHLTSREPNSAALWRGGGPPNLSLPGRRRQSLQEPRRTTEGGQYLLLSSYQDIDYI